MENSVESTSCRNYEKTRNSQLQNKKKKKKENVKRKDDARTYFEENIKDFDGVIAAYFSSF